ncbi:hypothetical protein BASA81_006394 [Batrachochytrium salamandrivorans]|nr:hypothetical protein BASA81_006394 [Batrachochytrium salamandrivorans]
MNFLSPSSAFNSPNYLASSAIKKVLPSSPAFSSTFEFETIPFLYDKKNKSWIELEDEEGAGALGKTMFTLDKSSQSIMVQCGNKLQHKISVSLQLQAKVAQSKCWVFRAVHLHTDMHDVVCLQLCENAPQFVSQYDKFRSRCLVEMETTTTPGKQSQLKSPFADGAMQKSLGVVLQGRDLSPVSTIELASTVGGGEKSGSRFRRRLSTAGSDPHLDGHSPGSRFEPVAMASPSKLSPMRSNATSGGPVTDAPASLLFSGISVKGHAPTNPDKPNQDAMVLHQLPNGELVLGVFDGHGTEGHDVSKYFKQRLPKLLATTGGEVDESSLVAALARTERELIENCRVDTTLSGSTGVVVLVKGNELTVANIGDSRAVLAMVESNKLVARDLTCDHKPDSPEEEKRILEVGGRVFAIKFDDGIDGPARVWLSYADYPGLAMSRSLCDTIAKEAGVISRPDVFHETVAKPSHRALIIASDGLWEFMSSQEVVDIVQKYNHEHDSPDPEGAVQELVRESNKRWRMNEPVVDDTTIIVAFFV